MIYENPPIYVDPKYWEKRAYAAEYRAGLAEARVAVLEFENRQLRGWIQAELAKRLEMELHAAGRGEEIKP